MSGKPTYEELEKKVIELEESKMFFENLLDMLPELVSYIDKNHTFKFGNRAYQKFFNIDSASMTGLHPKEVLGDEAFQEIESRHKAALSGQEQEYESTFLLPNGDPYYFHAHYLPHKEKDQTKGFLAVVQNITDRKKAEKKLRESEAKYRMLFENAEDAIFVADPDTGYLIDANKKAQELTGYNRTELIGKHQTFIHPSEDAVYYEQEFRKSIKNEGAKFREMLVQTRDGQIVPVEISSGGTIQSAEGKMHIGVFRDISDRKQAEKYLKDSEERFRLAMKFANDGLFDWKLETNEIYYSPVWKRLLGYEDDELPNDFSVWEKLTTPQDVKRSWKMQNELINQKRDKFEIEFKMQHKDGHWVDILSRANAIFDENGKAVRIIGTHVDISDRKKAEAALQESEQKYRHLIQTASDAIYLISETGRFSDVNTAACNMLNRSREEILNLDISGIDPNFSVEAFFEFWQETPLSEPRMFETTHLHKDGSLIPVEVNGQKFQVGEDVFFFGIARNIAARKKSEEILKESESKFRNIFQHANAGIALGDVEGNLIDVNDEFVRIVGYSKNELKKMNFADFTHPDDINNEIDLAEKIRAGEIDDYRISKRYITKNGEVRWVDVAITSRKSSENEVDMFIGMVLDITKQKNTELELIKSKEKLQLALDSADEGMWEWNFEKKKVFFDRGAMKMLGYTENDFDRQADSVLDLIHPDEKNGILQTADDYVSGKINHYDVEFRLRNKSGRYSWIWSVGKITAWDQNGKPTVFTGIHRDISERKKSEEALKISNQKYLSMVDNIGIGVALISTEMAVLELNKKMREWFPNISLDDDAICYRVFNNPPSDQICDYCPTCKTLQDGTVHESVTTTPSSGDVRNFRIVSSPIFDDDGNVKAAIEMVEDITERLKIEGQLQQARKMESIGTLAGGIAHDFNNILGIILGNTELAMDDVPDWNPARKNLDEARKACMRAKDVVRQILSFSRKSKAEQKPLNLASVVAESLRLIRASIPTSIDIRQNISNNMGDILGDATQIHQIMINLCTNAAHAMENEGGILEVTLENIEIDEDTASQQSELDHGSYAHLRVSDTGDGIRPDIIDRIFDPYFTTKDVGKGTGMGLAVVHGIVKSHHGSISVESKPGKGTAFRILFPSVEKKSEGETKIFQELPTGNEGILFVDDEASMVNLNRQRLEKLGYKVMPKTDPLEALEFFRSNTDQINLVITDMTMPKMTGDKLAQEILKIRPDIPIILCTGYSERMSEDRAQEIGVHKYIEKPIEMVALARSVREVLDGS